MRLRGGGGGGILIRVHGQEKMVQVGGLELFPKYLSNNINDDIFIINRYVEYVDIFVLVYCIREVGTSCRPRIHH